MTPIRFTLPADLTHLWVFVDPDTRWRCVTPGEYAHVPGDLATALVAAGLAEHTSGLEESGTLTTAVIRAPDGYGVWSPWCGTVLRDGESVEVPSSEYDRLTIYPRAGLPPLVR